MTELTRNRGPVVALIGALLLACSGSTARAAAPILPKFHDGQASSRVASSGRYAILVQDASRSPKLLVSRWQLGGAAYKPVKFGSDVSPYYEAEVAVANDGTVYVLYSRLVKKRPRAYELVLATVLPHKTHATIERLGARLKTPNSRPVHTAELALDANGRVALGYVTENTFFDTARVIFREPNGTYSAPVGVARSTGQASLDSPMMSFDNAGGLLAVVNQSGVECDAETARVAARCKSQYSTVFSARVIPGGFVTHRQEINGESDCSTNAVASHPDGSSMVALVCISNARNSRFRLKYATSSGTGPFGAVRWISLPDSKGDVGAQLVPVRGGRFMAIWNHDVKSVTNEGKYTEQILGTIVAADGSAAPSKALTPPAPQSVVDDDIFDLRPQLVVARDGLPYLAAPLTLANRQQIARIRDDLTLGPAIAVSPAKTADSRIRVSEAGLGLSLWLIDRRNDSVVGVSEFTLPPD